MHDNFVLSGVIVQLMINCYLTWLRLGISIGLLQKLHEIERVYII